MSQNVTQGECIDILLMNNIIIIIIIICANMYRPGPLIMSISTDSLVVWFMRLICLLLLWVTSKERLRLLTVCGRFCVRFLIWTYVDGQGDGFGELAVTICLTLE